MRKLVALTGLFSISAASAFVFTAPDIARSAVQTVPDAACQRVVEDVTCPFVAGTSLSSGALTRVYFDFYTLDGTVSNPHLGIQKTSYTGSVYSDHADFTFAAGSSTAVDLSVQAVTVRANASQWDYLEAYASRVGTLIGIAAVTD